MSDIFFQSHLLAVGCFVVLGLITIAKLTSRSAADVLEDLGDFVPSSKTEYDRESPSSAKEQELTFLSILSAEERKSIKRSQRNQILIWLLIGTLLGFLFFKAKIFLVLGCSFTGLCLGYLASEKKLRTIEENFKDDIIFFLPVVMERIVMAVQAGLDILPALKVIEEIESAGRKPSKIEEIDPVTRLLALVVRYTEAGLSFEQSLREVAGAVKSNALRHAFIHLAVAQKEGGELIYPLRELSDATQLYFQENIEEHIAKMPIKATMPLLLTFAGLIISFLTGPVIQILNISVVPTSVQVASEKNDAKR